MDETYFVEDIQPDRMNYADESAGFDHDLASVSRPLLPELSDKKTVRNVEQRAHKRYQVNKDAFVLIRPAAARHIRVVKKSMAEIACAVYRSEPVRFGRIDTISMGGLSFHYIPCEERYHPSLVLDILVADSGFYLENLTFKNVADFEVDDDFANNSFKMRLNRVQFEGLKPAAIMKLKYFLENFSFISLKKKLHERREPFHDT